MREKALPSVVEAMGLRPFSERFSQAMIALRGAEDVPPSQFDTSSLSQLRPSLGIPFWRGRSVIERRAVLTNLFNHRQTPIERGWSVKRTQTEDFRGKNLTYDSHNGTDFAIPIGSKVCSPAPGVVVRVYAEFNRGGHKVCIDHGDGLMTCSAHLARPLVREGQVLRRGELFAISGYSGLDSLVTFPWGVPHVHFNVWLNGTPVDPFARAGEESLWVGGWPAPAPRTPPEEPCALSVYDEARVAAVVQSCKTASVRERLQAISSFENRAATLVSERNYYPTRFTDHGTVYASVHPRAQRLHLPLSGEEFDGVVFVE